MQFVGENVVKCLEYVPSIFHKDSMSAFYDIIDSEGRV